MTRICQFTTWYLVGLVSIDLQSSVQSFVYRCLFCCLFFIQPLYCLRIKPVFVSAHKLFHLAGIIDIIFFSLTFSGIDPKIFRTRCEQANNSAQTTCPFQYFYLNISARRIWGPFRLFVFILNLYIVHCAPAIHVNFMNTFLTLKEPDECVLNYISMFLLCLFQD